MFDQQALENGAILLTQIEGARFTSVAFMPDHMILGFDAKGSLKTRVRPNFVQGQNLLSFGTPGYVDALCELIPRVIPKVAITAEGIIVLSFEGNARIEIAIGRDESSHMKVTYTLANRVQFAW